MAKLTFIKFKINNNFHDQEKTFCASQPAARNSGMLELSHGMNSNDPSSRTVLLVAESQEQMDNSMNEASNGCRQTKELNHRVSTRGAIADLWIGYPLPCAF